MTGGAVQQDEPGASVVIVTRDRAEALSRCLDALTMQEPGPDEIVVVRGNVDSCPESLLESFPSLSIRVVDCPEPNISAARNLGIAHALYDIVLFIDDDACARPGWISAYMGVFSDHPHAWIAGGSVLDARRSPPCPEFACGMIHPTGRQREVRPPGSSPPGSGFLDSVKGCNFAVHLGRMPSELRFDPFFRFAFDESDLVLRVHASGGGVVHVPDCEVEHLHARGRYRADGVMDRDWLTEFASHTRFMRKHTRGMGRIHGVLVVGRRFCKHALRAVLAAARGDVSPGRAWRCVCDALWGIMRGASFRGSV